MNEPHSQYESLVNPVFDSFTLVDANYRYLAVNDTYCRIQKRSREQILGRTVGEVWGEDTFQSVLKPHFDRCFAGEEVHDQRWFEFPEIGLRFFEVNYFPHWQAGEIAQAIVITRDFTERKLAEDAVRQSEERYRAATEDLEQRVADRTEELLKSNRALQVENAERRQVETNLRVRAEQQAAVAHLGQLALSKWDLDELFDQAVKVASRCCEVEFCKMLELAPDQQRLLLRAGVGWKAGLVGRASVSVHGRSQAGYTLTSDEPVIVENLREETRFSGPSLLLDHGVVSGISVIIRGHERRHGVLGVHTAETRIFTHDDINFLQSVANVLASAIDRRQTEAALRQAHNELEQRVAERTAELAQANDAVQKRERQLADAQRLAHVGSWEWDVASNMVSWSDETRRIFGVAPSNFKSTFEDYLKRVHPADRSFVRRQIEEAARRSRPFQFEERIIRPDGTVRTLHFQGETMTDAEGRPERMVGYCQDITERRQAELMWRRYEAIVNTSKEYFTLIDRRFRYAAANDAYCEAHGRSREEIVGHTIREIWGRRIYERVIRDKLRECFAGYDVHYEAWFHFKAAGSGCYEVNYYPLSHQGEVTHVIVITRNITQRKQAEEALRQSEEHYRELYHQAFLIKEDLRKLSNNMLHAQEEERKRISRELHDEVGQALTAINVNLTVLAHAGCWPEPGAGQKFEDTQRLLEQTMESIHRFARELRPAMLDELGLLPALRSYIKTFMSRNRIQVVLRNGVKTEELDGEQKTVLYRVAQESLNNVAKHAQATRVVVDLKKVNNQLRMQIKDNGRSFDASKPDQVGKSRRLGLLGMEERVRLVHGNFRLIPKPGRGTTVRVDIPLSRPDHLP